MSGSMEISLVDGSLFDKLSSKGVNIPPRLSEMKNKATLSTANNVMDEAPKVTSNLEGATRTEELDLFSSRIYPDEGVAPYALYILLGIDPYVIKGDPWLFWPGAEHPVREVHHPGIEADPYFERGFANSQSDIEEAKQEFINWITNLDS